MSPRRQNKKRKCKVPVPVEAGDGEDRISDLHDDLLRHVISFLPAHEAVRTCVLSRRWREVWKSTRVLRFTEAETWGSAARFNKFVNDLMSFRDVGTLDELVFRTYLFRPQITSNAYADIKEPVRYAKTWIEYALTRDVQVLRVLVNARDRSLLLNTPVISRHLRTLDLKTVLLKGTSMDFSGCPALEDLEVNHCKISAPKILSQSLRRLCLSRCKFSAEKCTRIMTPNLLSLRLDADGGRVPLLQRMPLLVTAYIRLDDYSRDRYWHSYSKQCGSDACVDCYNNSYGSDSSVLLRSLSNATYLELAAQLRMIHHGVAIFKNDMLSPPTFSKLKTVVLYGWVVASEVHAVVHFLRHAPVLEKISIRLWEERKYNTNRVFNPTQVEQYVVDIEESCRVLEEQLLPSEHLKMIEVSCSSSKDGRTDKLVKFVDGRSATVQAEVPTSMSKDAPVSESEMIRQRHLHHYGAKAAKHFRIKWNSRPPASLAIWESDPGPLHHLYNPPDKTTPRLSKRIRKSNSLYPESLWVK